MHAAEAAALRSAVERAEAKVAALRSAVDRVRTLHAGAHPCRGGRWWTDDPGYAGSVATQGDCPTLQALATPVGSSGEAESGEAKRTCSMCGHTVSEAMGGWRHDGSLNDDDLDQSHPIELTPAPVLSGGQAPTVVREARSLGDRMREWAGWCDSQRTSPTTEELRIIANEVDRYLAARPVLSREALARIIEPDAWSLSDLEWHDDYGRTTSVTRSLDERGYVRQSALNRAGKILTVLYPEGTSNAGGQTDGEKCRVCSADLNGPHLPGCIAAPVPSGGQADGEGEASPLGGTVSTVDLAICANCREKITRVPAASTWYHVGHCGVHGQQRCQKAATDALAARPVLSREALRDLLADQGVRVQVPGVGTVTGFLRRESADSLADHLAGGEQRG